MGILTRFKDIMSANINALLDKCEDPAKMIDEYMRQLTEQLAEVKQETAKVMADEKRTKRLVEENDAQIKKYDDLARKALVAGNEGDAKVFLEKKQEFVKLGVDLQKSADIATENASRMRQMHDKLTKDIQSLEQRRTNIKAKVTVAKTQEKLNKVTTSMNKTSDSMKAFERMEEKADKMLDTANSVAELDSIPEDPAKDLEAKYASSETSVNEELENLKKEMGL